MKTNLRKEKKMTIKKISDQWYRLTLKRTEEENLMFFGYSKREVIGKLKQHLRAEARG